MADGDAGRSMTTKRGSVVKMLVWCARFSVALVPVVLLANVICNGASAAAPCANESLRSELGSSVLPECRAYEMVSPPYKGGQPLLVIGYAADGEKAILHSFAGIVGTPGSGESIGEPNWYLANRTAGGWRLSGTNAPLSEFVGQIPDAGEADDGLSLWTQHTPRQSAKTAGLYIRSASGEYAWVGTLSPKSIGEKGESDFAEVTDSEFDDSPVAGTSSYQHIVIRAEVSGAHWPFDATLSAESLYEYSGMNNERPVLVAATGSEKGSEKLLAPCGATFGGGLFGATFNALSRDGETIFFTLEPCAGKPAEVYARIHGAATSPGAAESVNVGENHCNTECGGESGKNFEGASENGEKVFFTSTQKLTDDAGDLTAGGNAAEGAGCASIVTGCNLYEYDFGQPAHRQLTLIAGGAEDVRGVAGIAEDGLRIYFVADGEVPGSGENEFDRKPVTGKPNLYVYDTDTGVTAFIATLTEGDSQAWHRAFLRPVEVASEDGSFLLFVSSAVGVTPGETSAEGFAQLFEYDAETRELVRVSQGEDGYGENGNDVTRGIDPESIADMATSLGSVRDFKTTANLLNVADNGKTVVFIAAGALSPRAVSASSSRCTSVYEFSSEGPISAGQVHLLSDGRDVQLYQGVRCGATFKAMDAEGSNVLIFTADPLLTSDVDGVQPDIYDVRVNGGFPPAVPGEEAGSCSSGVCGSRAGAGPGPGAGAAPSAEGDYVSRPPAAGTSGQVVPPKGSPPPQTGRRVGRLAGALRACRSERKRRRAACESAVRRRFASAKSQRRGS